MKNTEFYFFEKTIAGLVVIENRFSREKNLVNCSWVGHHEKTI